jgi:guanylate kinase
VAKHCAIEGDDSLLSEDSMLVNNLEKPIPRKTNYKFRVAKADSKTKPTKKAHKKEDNEEIDIGFLSAVKEMQIEDEYDMLDYNDDVLLLDDEKISITIVLMSEGYP